MARHAIAVVTVPVPKAVSGSEALLDEVPVSEIEAFPSSTVPVVAAEEEGFVWPEGSLQAAEGALPENPEKPSDQPPVELEGPLPPLDQLIGQLPPETREVLEDLFRARFVGVRRIQKNALK